MIRLGGLVSQKAFGKFEMGKVISNPFANAFVNEAEGSEDHEVSMGQNQLDTIIKMATELKAKMGENEKEIPAWIQDHISKAENYISQAAGNYHEYGTNEASVPTGERIQNLNNRIKALRDKLSATKSPEQKKLFQDRLKNALQTLSNIKKDYGIKKESVNEAVDFRDGKYRFYSKDGVGYLTYDGKKLSSGDFDWEDGSNSYWMSHSSFKGSQKAFDTGKDVINYFKSKKITTESVNEESPCWKGYKQVGMKDKGGRQVPNCVPNESVVREISSRTPKIFVKTAAVEKKIKELMADRKKAVVPYNNETDPAKKEKLKQILIKLTNQIKGYENNLVKLRDMEEEYLQQMHADAELDTTGL